MKYLFAIVTLFISTISFAQSNTQHDAHEHGVGNLNMATAGNQLAMELAAPGADIVGFEYAASSEQDKLAVEQALQQLHNPAKVISLPARAQCQLVEAHAHLESDAEHTEFHAEYLYECANVSALQTFTFPYFQSFPNALELEVQIVNDSGARAFEVERAEPQLEF